MADSIHNYFLLEAGQFGGFCNKGKTVETTASVTCSCMKNHKKNPSIKSQTTGKPYESKINHMHIEDEQTDSWQKFKLSYKFTPAFTLG